MSITMCTVWSKPTYVLICLIIPIPSCCLVGAQIPTYYFTVLTPTHNASLAPLFRMAFVILSPHAAPIAPSMGRVLGPRHATATRPEWQVGWKGCCPSIGSYCSKWWLSQGHAQVGSPCSLSSMPKGFWVSSSCAGQMVPSQLALHLAF